MCGCICTLAPLPLFVALSNDSNGCFLTLFLAYRPVDARDGRVRNGSAPPEVGIRAGYTEPPSGVRVIWHMLGGGKMVILHLPCCIAAQETPVSLRRLGIYVEPRRGDIKGYGCVFPKAGGRGLSDDESRGLPATRSVAQAYERSARVAFRRFHSRFCFFFRCCSSLLALSNR